MSCLMHGNRNYTGGGGASAISDLTDVSLNNLANSQILKYNSTTQKWENSNESGGGSGGGYATFRQKISCNVDSSEANKEVVCQIQKTGYLNDGTGSSYCDFTNCTIIPCYIAVEDLEYQNASVGSSQRIKNAYTLQDVNMTGSDYNRFWINLDVHNLGAFTFDTIYLKIGFVYFGTPTPVNQ